MAWTEHNETSRDEVRDSVREALETFSRPEAIAADLGLLHRHALRLKPSGRVTSIRATVCHCLLGLPAGGRGPPARPKQGRID